MSYDISQRTHELGIRMALGASSGDVVRVVLGAALRALAIGVGTGLGLALLSGRFIAAFLIDTTPYDPVVFGVVICTVAGASAVAILGPALHAARLDPAGALRAD